MPRRLLLAVLLAALVRPDAAGTLLPPLPLPEATLNAYFAGGGTLVGELDGSVWVERYEPGGRVRGTYRGRGYAGIWSIRGTELCTQHEGARRSCVGLLSTRLGDGAAHTPATPFIIRYEDGRSGHGYYRRQAPWGPALPTTLLGLVRLQVEGGFFLTPPEGEGSLYVAWPAPVQRHLWPDTVIMVRGTTDGVTVAATVVTRADGSPVERRLPGR